MDYKAKMKKILSKNCFNNAIVIICIVLPHFILAMQAPQGEKIFTSDQIVLNLVAAHYLLDHEAICSFAATSKYNNHLVLSTAKNRSQLLEPSYGYLSTLLHKYGTARYYVSECHLGLILSFRELFYHKWSDSIVNYIRENKVLSGFISPLWDKQKIFFDGNENICFYGYGRIKNDDTSTSIEGILKFCIDGSVEYCIFDKKIDQTQNGLHRLLLHPCLLKALLQSQGKKTIFNHTNHAIPAVEYCFDEVMIPQDYNNRITNSFFHKIHRKKSSDISIFKKIPDFIGVHIEKRLKEQAEKAVIKSN